MLSSWLAILFALLFIIPSMDALASLRDTFKRPSAILRGSRCLPAHAPDAHQDRRDFLRQTFLQSPMLATATILATCITLQQPAEATILSTRETPFTPGELLTIDQALERFQQGRDSLHYLIDHYGDIQAGGGDNVRRYLGTVGTSSGLYGISKVMRSLLQNNKDTVDLVEFTEAMTEIEQSIQQADGSAYMAIFVTTSTSSVPPEKYFGDALIEAKRAAKGMDEMATLLGLDKDNTR